VIGAPHNVLVEEASTIKLLMRMAESKGAMEFHPDLVHYYASEHGGLNEYSNRVWKRREGQNLVNHFKADEDLLPDELDARRAKTTAVFTSALAQRLVMSRLERKAKYNPNDQMALAKKSYGKGSGRVGPDMRVMMHVKHRCGMLGKRKIHVKGGCCDKQEPDAMDDEGDFLTTAHSLPQLTPRTCCCCCCCCCLLLPACCCLLLPACCCLLLLGPPTLGSFSVGWLVGWLVWFGCNSSRSFSEPEIPQIAGFEA
jgi:hypothetical protein